MLVFYKYFWPNLEISIFCFEIWILKYFNSDLEGLKKVCNFSNSTDTNLSILVYDFCASQILVTQLLIAPYFFSHAMCIIQYKVKNVLFPSLPSPFWRVFFIFFLLIFVFLKEYLQNVFK